jgi:hypothetical protein
VAEKTWFFPRMAHPLWFSHTTALGGTTLRRYEACPVPGELTKEAAMSDPSHEIWEKDRDIDTINPPFICTDQLYHRRFREEAQPEETGGSRV